MFDKLVNKFHYVSKNCIFIIYICGNRWRVDVKGNLKNNAKYNFYLHL